jgi:hypothetical protein
MSLAYLLARARTGPVNLLTSALNYTAAQSHRGEAGSKPGVKPYAIHSLSSAGGREFLTFFKILPQKKKTINKTSLPPSLLFYLL